jgi:DUF4097 and DUF4098 domain-containing protein YvlB
MEESGKRTLWIVVVAVAALSGLAICTCALIAAAVGGGILYVTPLRQSEELIDDGKRPVNRYEVGPAPSLTIDNFAGSITVSAGESGAIEVIAHKQVGRQRDLERREVNIRPQDGGLAIETRRPPGGGRAMVQLEIRTPIDTRLEARTGSGSIEVRGLRGGAQVDTGSGSLVLSDLAGQLKANTGTGSIEVDGVEGEASVDTGSGSLRLYAIHGGLVARTGTGSVEIADVQGGLEAHTGSGRIDVQEAIGGPAKLDTGSGRIEYSGQPAGPCRFETGSGDVTLNLPANLNMALDLHTGTGQIDVDYELAGSVTAGGKTVKGIVGSGERGEIYARTGSGDIRLVPHQE